MADPSLLVRLFLHRSPPSSTAISRRARTLITFHNLHNSNYSTISNPKLGNEEKTKQKKKNNGKWLTLPPFTVDYSSLGKRISRTRDDAESTSGGGSMTAVKWVVKCCPDLPRSLVQKLFRLRQVRRESYDFASSNDTGQIPGTKIKRVAAKDLMKYGDKIFLPCTIQELPSEKAECLCSDEELKFLQSIELYKDPAIIVVNKPPGMPVQGGIGISRSLDEMAGKYLRYDYSEPPRLVHRLDRDSSGILVLGRTQSSATVLHSIFREKTIGASSADLRNEKRFLKRRYMALVFGSPRSPEGIISVPLRKVVSDDGKSERITVADNVENIPSQHAITQYRVISSTTHGYAWLELSPLTGRKHQLRVHCAEVLGTPIVGDLKYGWQAHRKWKHLSSNLEDSSVVKDCKGKTNPFGLDLGNGSVSEKQPSLHLHCKEMSLPDVSFALQQAHSSSDFDFTTIKSLSFVAPLPLHMRRSWDILNS